LDGLNHSAKVASFRKNAQAYQTEPDHQATLSVGGTIWRRQYGRRRRRIRRVGLFGRQKI
jgi:hypothetical protein